jgi:tetratricopeptide (TPR) repeat protein
MSRMGIVTAVLLLSLGLAACKSKEERREEYVREAEAYLEQGKVREALITLRSALQLAPKDAALNFQIAGALQRAGDLVNSVFYLQETLRLEPTHTDAALSLSWLLMGDDPDESEKLIREVLEREPDNLTAHLRRSELALVRVDMGEAVAAARTAVELEPDSPRGYMQLGIVRRAGILERELREQEPDDQLAEEAVDAFRSALERMDADAPARGRAWSELVTSLHQWTGHEKEAAEAVAAALADAENIPTERMRLVDQLSELSQRFGDLESERKARFAAVEGPRRGRWRHERDHWDRLADIEEAEGGSSAELLAKMLERWPKSATVHSYYAIRLSGTEEGDQAVAHLEEVLPQVDRPEIILEAIAFLAFAEGDVEDAKAAVARLEKDYPETPQAKLTSASILLSEGKHGAAAERLRTLLDTYESSRAQQLLAQAELALGNVRRAKTAIDRSLEMIPQRPWKRRIPLLNLRLQIEVRLREWEDALETVAELRNMRGGRLIPAEIVHSARALYGTGRKKAALRQLDIVLYGDNPPMGAVLLFARNEGADQPQRARTLLQQTLLRQPTNLAVHEHLARLDFQAGNPERALRRIDNVLAGREDDAQLLVLRARTNIGLGNHEDALADVDRAMAVDPSVPSATAMRVQALRALGREADAVAALEDSVKQGRANSSQMLVLARMLMLREENERAEELLERVLERRPGDAGAQNDLAYLISERGGDMQRALELARAARAARPQGAEIADTLGVVYLRMELGGAALDQFDSAIELANEGEGVWASALYHRGLALKSLGRADEAVEQLEAVLAAAVDFPEAEEARRELQALLETRSPAAESS